MPGRRAVAHRHVDRGAGLSLPAAPERVGVFPTVGDNPGGNIGGKIWLCPWMKTHHVGTYAFTGDMPAVANFVGSL